MATLELYFRINLLKSTLYYKRGVLTIYQTQPPYYRTLSPETKQPPSLIIFSSPIIPLVFLIYVCTACRVFLPSSKQRQLIILTTGIAYNASK